VIISDQYISDQFISEQFISEQFVSYQWSQSQVFQLLDLARLKMIFWSRFALFEFNTSQVWVC